MRLISTPGLLATAAAFAIGCATAQTSGIVYSTPTSTNVSASDGHAVYPTPDTELAPTNVTGQVPSGFQPPTLIQDNGTYGPAVEIVHYYYDQWPIGLAVDVESASNDSGQARVLACYVRGDYAYTLGRITNITAEEAYPSQELNLSPAEAWDQVVGSITGYPFGSNSSTKLINVQALYQSPDGAVWVLDTGRPTVTTQDGSSVIAYAQVGGPKLIRLAANGTFERTYTFPGNVHYPDSYMNDVRFDMRSNITQAGQGVAYIVDSSDEGRNGFIILDLGTGKSWRRLTQHPSTLHIYGSRASYLGQPFYEYTPGQSRNFLLEGFDGLALSSDGAYAYYAPLDAPTLYRVPTSYLLADDAGVAPAPQNAEADAAAHVETLGGKGSQTNGFDTDSNGVIYMSAPEQNAVYMYDPAEGVVRTFVRDPRFFWIDSMVVAGDGYLYGNVNQLPDQASWNNGTDYRTKPGFMFRVKLPNGGTRVTNTLMG